PDAGRPTHWGPATTGALDTGGTRLSADWRRGARVFSGEGAAGRPLAPPQRPAPRQVPARFAGEKLT
nr:hypothetical protein [Tanacetum cinerariifolium]